MDLFIDQLLSSIATILVMLLLPLIWWLVTARKAQNFFSWIGRPRRKQRSCCGFLASAGARPDSAYENVKNRD